MQPFFSGDPRKQRRINLGGASVVATHEEILQKAKAIRDERTLYRQREEAATKIQASWRGYEDRKALKEDLMHKFDADPTCIGAIRCLVMLKGDEKRLATWTERVLKVEGVENLIKRLKHENSIMLLYQLLDQLLSLVAQDPNISSAVMFLSLLNATLDPSILESSAIIRYLLPRGYYTSLKQATEKIPPERKNNSPSIPLIASLYTTPFKVVTGNHEVHQACILQLFLNILTIPLLPNRLPISSLSQFSASLPYNDTDILSSSLHLFSELPIQSRIHLLANLATFIPPRYKLLTTKSLVTYLKLLTTIISGLPASVFKLPTPPADGKQAWPESDDSDEEEAHLNEESTTLNAPESIDIDAKTRSRIRVFGSREHATQLLAAVRNQAFPRVDLFVFLTTVYSTLNSFRDDILSTFLATTGGGGLVRELYRDSIRSSPLGKLENDLKTLKDPANASTWPLFIFIVDLYSYALLTMGDDEFFASRTQRTSASPHRNPLTVDEVIAFSKQVLNIAFTLYWSDALNSSQHVSGTSLAWEIVPGTSLTWETVRGKLTELLQAIHARDSRRPFTPPNHWLLSSQVDMETFVEAAVFKDMSLTTSTDTLTRRRDYSKRYLAKISPHLGILNNIPFAIPFEKRVEIFHRLIRGDRDDFPGYRHGTHIAIRRERLAQDGFDKLRNVDLKGNVVVQFIDKFGNTEAGIDGGGVFKEFFTSLCKEVFDTDRGLWLATKQQELYPNPHSYAKEASNLEWYRFIGRILGKAMYEGILVDVAFAGFFLAKWLDKQSYLDDLASLDIELYNGLVFLKNYDGNPEDLSLTFAVTEEEFGVTRTIDLIPNGSAIPVTRENRLRYIYAVCHFHLSRQIRKQSDAFFDGLSELVDPKWLRMFNQQELQILVGGVNSPIDFDDLRRNTNYGGLLKDDLPYVESFWKVLNSFNHEQRQAFLRFATSCSRPPLLGFKELNPKFNMRDAGTDQDRLPTASTCFNLLKLPLYKSEELMKKKLLQAITSGAGFDLS